MAKLAKKQDITQGELVVRRLEVRLDGQADPVGMLEGLATNVGFPIRFTYRPGYSGPPLSASMPISRGVYEDRDARVFFDNLLPEGPQRRSVQLVEGGHPVNQDDVSGLLAVLGAECPGAVSVVPEGSPPTKAVGHLDEDYEQCSEADVASLLSAAARGESLDRVLRFSLAGVQRKLALTFDAANGVFLRPKRPGIPTTHLLKVEAAGETEFRGIVRNELLCLRLAQMVGLPTCRAKSAEFGGLEALIVERFDRVINGRTVRRIHQEDAAQALGLDRSEKYEDEALTRRRLAGIEALIGTFGDLTASPADARDLLRRAVFFNWLIGNTDAHMKNFALLYEPEAFVPTIAPLYDLVAVQALSEKYQLMAMKLDGVSDGDLVGQAALEWLARAPTGNGGRLPKTALRARLDKFKAIAEAALPAIDEMVAKDEFGRMEAKPIRDLVASRIRQASADLGWKIEAIGDAPYRSGGGWHRSR
jgi:serine/threonine-protein kinase HipA